jgi:hypothetical protein
VFGFGLLDDDLGKYLVAAVAVGAVLVTGLGGGD